jgi:hypothetical protein
MSPTSQLNTSLENLVCNTEGTEKPSRVILVPLDASEVTGKVLQWITDYIIDPNRDLVVLFSAYHSASRDLPIGMGFDFEGAGTD